MPFCRFVNNFCYIYFLLFHVEHVTFGHASEHSFRISFLTGWHLHIPFSLVCSCGVGLLSAPALFRVLPPRVRARGVALRLGVLLAGWRLASPPARLVRSRVMKRLHFTPRRVAFRVAPSARPGIACFQSGVICGHYVVMERAWFDGRPCWVRYYAICVTSGPSSVRGTVAQVAAEHVFRWPVVLERKH